MQKISAKSMEGWRSCDRSSGKKIGKMALERPQKIIGLKKKIHWTEDRTK